MKLHLATVGKLKSGPEQELHDKYLDRARKTGGQLGFPQIELLGIKEANSGDVLKRKQQEANALLELMPGDRTLIALDEFGEDISSTKFAHYLSSNRDNGIGHMVFAIGGADGHGKELLQCADKKLRFGRMTWPHQIARILLIEQIYRSMTILVGHPYHKQ